MTSKKMKFPKEEWFFGGVLGYVVPTNLGEDVLTPKQTPRISSNSIRFNYSILVVVEVLRKLKVDKCPISLVTCVSGCGSCKIVESDLRSQQSIIPYNFSWYFFSF